MGSHLLILYQRLSLPLPALPPEEHHDAPEPLVHRHCHGYPQKPPAKRYTEYVRECDAHAPHEDYPHVDREPHVAGAFERGDDYHVEVPPRLVDERHREHHEREGVDVLVLRELVHYRDLKQLGYHHQYYRYSEAGEEVPVHLLLRDLGHPRTNIIPDLDLRSGAYRYGRDEHEPQDRYRVDERGHSLGAERGHEAHYYYLADVVGYVLPRRRDAHGEYLPVDAPRHPEHFALLEDDVAPPLEHNPQEHARYHVAEYGRERHALNAPHRHPERAEDEDVVAEDAYRHRYGVYHHRAPAVAVGAYDRRQDDADRHRYGAGAVDEHVLHSVLVDQRVEPVEADDVPGGEAERRTEDDGEDDRQDDAPLRHPPGGGGVARAEVLGDDDARARGHHHI